MRFEQTRCPVDNLEPVEPLRGYLIPFKDLARPAALGLVHARETGRLISHNPNAATPIAQVNSVIAKYANPRPRPEVSLELDLDGLRTLLDRWRVREIEARTCFCSTKGRLPARLTRAGAIWLFSERARLEPEFGTETGLVTAAAFCICCGELFTDGRARHGYVAEVAAFCASCRNRRARHLEPARVCAATDCLSLFVPRRSNHLYCSNRCRSAAPNVS